MKHTMKIALFYVLAALYVLAYYITAIPAFPNVVLGHVVDIGREGFKTAAISVFWKTLKYDLDSLRIRVLGGGESQNDTAETPAASDDADEDEPQAPGYDHTDHLTHVAAAYEHTGEHKLISDEE